MPLKKAQEFLASLCAGKIGKIFFLNPMHAKLDSGDSLS